MKIFTKIVLMTVLLASYNLCAAELDDFQENRNINNYGRNFYLSVPPSFQDENLSEPNYVKLFIGSVQRANVTVEVPAKAYKRSIIVMPGEINQIIIPPEIAQPFIKKVELPAPASKIYQDAGIKVISDEDIFVYVLSENNVSKEGYLAYPTKSLGTKYLLSSYGDGSYLYPLYHSFPSITTIVSNFDNSIVSFTLGGNAATTSSDGKVPYQKITKVLDEGDVWVISTQGNFADLSGSFLESSKPVSLIVGNQSANVPINNRWSDYIVEMMAPTETWGKKYHTFKIKDKRYNPVIRVFSKYDSTKVFINNVLTDTIPKSGGLENEGYIELRTDVNEGSLNVISGDKPIYVQMYNTGSEEDGMPVISGGPFQLGLISEEQFSNESLISMPGIDEPGSGYDDTYLIVISNAAPKDIEIAEVTINNTDWRNLLNFGIAEQGKYPLDGMNYYLIKMPKNGIFRMKAPEKFCSYIYGIDDNTAFAYQGSNNLQYLGDDREAPVPEWEQLCNGNVVGSVEDYPLENSSNLAYAIFDRTKSNNYEFEIETIIPGVTFQANWELTVKNKKQNATAVIYFRDKSNNDTTIKIEYKAPNVSLNPNYHDFGSFTMSSPITQQNYHTFVFTNHSDTVFNVDKLNFLKKTEGFSFQNEFVPVSLQPNDKFEFTVFFNPVKSDRCFDSIGIGNDCYFEYMGFVEAEVGIPIIEVSDARFDNVMIEQSKYQDIIIKNIGKTDITLEDIKGTFTSEFSVVGDIGFSQSNPYVLKPEEEYSFTVKFYAENENVYSDSVIVISDAGRKIDNVAILQANVIPQGLSAESYSWNRKRIYRSDYPAGPYPVNNENNGILLENTSDNDITISGINIVEDLNGSAFEFNKGLLKNLIIKANDDFILPVNFRPQEIGEHKLVIEYIDNVGGKARTTLQGTGVAPKIQVMNIDFDTCIVENYISYKTMDIIVKNIGYDEWAYADTLNLFGLMTNDDVSMEWFDFNNNEFKISNDFINYPVKINPGNIIVIKAAYVPIDFGYDEVDLQTISDALEDSEFSLSGFGIFHNIVVTGGSIITCMNTPAKLVTTISNKSTNSIDIAEIKLKENNFGFSFADPANTKDFSIPPNASQNIELYFNPMSTSDYNNEIIVTTESEPNITRKAEINGYVTFTKRNIVTTPTSKIGKIGQKTLVSLILEDGDDISNYAITSFEANVKYNTSMLSIENHDIILGDKLNGKFELTDKIIDENEGVVNLKFKSIMNNVLKDAGNLVDMYFYVYFPIDSSDRSLIEVEFTSDRDDCVEFNEFSGKIELQPICVDDLRRLNVSGYDFSLAEISPNPVNTNSASLSFSVGFETNVNLALYNYTGEKIIDVENGFLKAGNYDYMLDLQDVPSGIYWYKLEAGPYTKALPIVIRK